MSDMRELYHIAEAVMDDAEKVFRAGVGAAPVHAKPDGDFATEMDLVIEQRLRTALTSLTGIPVYGEEYGGEHAATDALWIVDPIDGTANYACGNPMCAILISLVVENRPTVALTSVPMVYQRFGAYAGSPLFVNGTARKPTWRGPHVACSSDDAELLQAVKTTKLRPRITGSVGTDLAFAAAGVVSAAVSLSPYVWDNTAGALLGQAAGATITDRAGNPWVFGAEGMIIGSAAAHDSITTSLGRNPI